MRILSYLLLAGALAVFAGGLILPDITSASEVKKAEGEAFKYIGAEGCKMCHSKEKNGLIYEKWEQSAHAKAFTVLGEANQKNDKCLGCHTTGHGKALAAGVTADKMQGVGCEACHGPGSEYKAMKVMKDKALSMEKGLIEANEKICKTCHTADLPKDCWKGADAAPKFEFAAAAKKIEHKVPKAE